MFGLAERSMISMMQYDVLPLLVMAGGYTYILTYIQIYIHIVSSVLL
jgi:hypothetical protein